MILISNGIIPYIVLGTCTIDNLNWSIIDDEILRANSYFILQWYFPMAISSWKTLATHDYIIFLKDNNDMKKNKIKLIKQLFTCILVMFQSWPLSIRTEEFLVYRSLNKIWYK